MNIILCDDNPSFLRELKHAVQQHCAVRDWSCDLRCFESPKALLSADLTGAQVLFLDIDMPDINGLEAARVLRRRYPELCIVFVTAFLEYAPAGYAVDAFRYLLKPNLAAELPLCMDALWDRLFVTQASIIVRRPEQTERVQLRNILYLEGTPTRHILLHTVSGGNPMDCMGRLADFDTDLEPKGFLRIQKSFLVNMVHITDIRNYYAYLDNGENLKVSQQNYASVCKKYILWRGRTL